ncbi:hypothetical protein [Pseudomonas fluorescens]|uniref:hypothetical protein n=1 Tax=Pseudomonas fluorescens TaxID=294 RepID=UPI001BE88525|nr:hypothetical protein [Pseudomonas fluorescens]MBT2372313.1 hypothetical protein [Pseudomonas fluorescens]
MSQHEPSPVETSGNSLLYFVVGVLCAAVLLGIYFVRLNAQVDQQRMQETERLLLCRQAESLTPSGLDKPDGCKYVRERASAPQ